MNHVMGRLNQRMYQAVYKGKKYGNPVSYTNMRILDSEYLINVKWKEVLL